MFENATREKYRFDSTKGYLTVEDLWDVPLTSTKNNANLDDIARSLHKQLKNDDDVSFVNVDKKSDPTVQAKFDIVKHIIEVRLAENAVAAKKRSDAEKRQHILSIIADREDDALRTMPMDDLRKALSEL